MLLNVELQTSNRSVVVYVRILDMIKLKASCAHHVVKIMP
jgi:hypothetical protein